MGLPVIEGPLLVVDPEDPAPPVVVFRPSSSVIGYPIPVNPATSRVLSDLLLQIPDGGSGRVTRITS